MKALVLLTLLILPPALVATYAVDAADESKVQATAGHAESGARKILDGKIAEDIAE